MSAVSTQSLHAIARALGVPVGELFLVVCGERTGTRADYRALRAADYPLTLGAIARASRIPAAAKIRHQRQQRKAKAATQAEAIK